MGVPLRILKVVDHGRLRPTEISVARPTSTAPLVRALVWHTERTDQIPLIVCEAKERYLKPFNQTKPDHRRRLSISKSL